MRTILRLGYFVLLLAVGCASASAEELPPQPLPRGAHLPLEVHLSMRVLDLTRIEETKGEISARVEFITSWKDPGLGFDPVEAGLYRRDYYGSEAEGELRKLWSPALSVANQVSEPRVRSIALSVHSTGEVTMISEIDADFRIIVDLSAFPFDRQKLDFVLTAPRYDASQVVLAVDDRDREISSVANALSSSDWMADGISFKLQQFYGWNAKPFAKATVTATVGRAWPRYLLRIFIPFAAVVSVSLFILWAPRKLKVDHAGITYSALLALAALSFTFESSFPGSMSVNSPIAFMTSFGYFYLVLTLLVHLMLEHANFAFMRNNPFLISEIRRNIRFTLPAMFALICACSVIRSLS
jgi:hypothetical protein